MSKILINDSDSGTDIIFSDTYDGGNLKIDGTLKHNGLEFTNGTAVDQLSTFNVSMTVSTAWQDTYINAADLASGAYAVLIQHGSNIYTGSLAWFAGDTTEATADEIVLHEAGATTGNRLFLRTVRTITSDTNDLKLQIAGTTNDSSASSIVVKLRRII